MNSPCIRCGAPAARTVRALEIRTLRIRGFDREHRVQAVGRELESGVCERCARESLDLSLNPFRAVQKQLAAFGAVLAAGLLIGAITFLFLDGNRVFMLPGIAALICGLLGIAEAVRNANEKSRALRSMPEDEALEEAAWDVFIAGSPKKEGENDLTYIPVTDKTLQRKNGDLMVLYNLLPDIAAEAWNRLHPAPEQQGGNI